MIPFDISLRGTNLYRCLILFLWGQFVTLFHNAPNDHIPFNIWSLWWNGFYFDNQESKERKKVKDEADDVKLFASNIQQLDATGMGQLHHLP